MIKREKVRGEKVRAIKGMNGEKTRESWVHGAKMKKVRTCASYLLSDKKAKPKTEEK